jgi:Tfp pilus assembly PilM family ATPase
MFGSRREIIGIDLGTASAKAVVLRLSADGEAPLVREYTIVPTQPGGTAIALEQTLARVFRKLRTRSRDCAIAVWPAGAKFRFFDRGTPEAARAIPNIKPEEVRQLFHEELNGYVSVCGKVESCQEAGVSSMCVAEAVPKEAIDAIEGAVKNLGRRLRVVQLTPLALLNAFTSSCLEVAREEPFLVTDFGRERALIIGGYRGLARVIRVVDFPWEAIISGGKEGSNSPTSAMTAQGMEAMQTLLRELVDVCDFLDAQDHHTRLARMHVSGALSSNAEVMRTLGQALEVSCVSWNPLRCAVAADRALQDFQLMEDLSRLPLAAGVALQYAA